MNLLSWSSHHRHHDCSEPYLGGRWPGRRQPRVWRRCARPVPRWGRSLLSSSSSCSRTSLPSSSSRPVPGWSRSKSSSLCFRSSLTSSWSRSVLRRCHFFGPKELYCTKFPPQTFTGRENCFVSLVTLTIITNKGHNLWSLCHFSDLKKILALDLGNHFTSHKASPGRKIFPCQAPEIGFPHDAPSPSEHVPGRGRDVHHQVASSVWLS